MDKIICDEIIDVTDTNFNEKNMPFKTQDMIIKIRTYCFFNDIIDIEHVHANNIKIDEKSYKNIFIYYIGYVTIKEYVKIYSLNPLHLTFSYVN